MQDLTAFELAATANNTKEVGKVRRRARIASSDLTQHHGSVLGMSTSVTVGGGPRIYVFGANGVDVITGTAAFFFFFFFFFFLLFNERFADSIEK